MEQEKVDLREHMLPTLLANKNRIKIFDKVFCNNDYVYIENFSEVQKNSNSLTTMTDYALANGGVKSLMNIKTPSGLDHTTKFWLRSSSIKGNCVDEDGKCENIDCNRTNLSVCPVIEVDRLAYVSIPPKATNIKHMQDKDGKITYHTIEYGEYPKTKVENKLNLILESKYSEKSPELILTGKKYTGFLNEKFKYEKNDEYIYKNNKYVRTRVNNINYAVQYYEDFSKIGPLGSYVWIKVEPITWKILNWDKMTKDLNPKGSGEATSFNLRSEKAIISGIPFYTNKVDDYRGLWQNSTIRGYLNGLNVNNVQINGSAKYSAPNGGDFSENNFYNEAFIVSRENIKENAVENVEKAEEVVEGENAKKKNPYGLEFKREITPEEEIFVSIKANEPVFIHGLPGDGKSARVKQIDPECTELLLASFSLDRLNGKTIFNPTTGKTEDKPPAWYDELVEKCTKEADKLHILFLDELTNALPTIQSEALTLVQDRKVNGRFKLPDNCRIVAAGNEMEDSEAAWKMIQPLFGRFGHVTIKTTKENWLPWAAKAQIHPAVYAFIAFKGDEALRTPYTGEADKPNANPRSWEKVSNELNAGLNPYYSKKHIGVALAEEFAKFCQKKVITLEDVLNENYSENDFDIETDEKYLTVTGLTSVNEKNVGVVRKFIDKLGKEMLATFDSYWAHGDQVRFGQITELRKVSLNAEKGGAEI